MKREKEPAAEWLAREEADWNGEPFFDDETGELVYPEDSDLGQYLSMGPHEKVEDYRLRLTAVPKPPPFKLRQFLAGYICQAMFETGPEGERIEKAVNEYIASLHPLAHFTIDKRISVASMQAALEEYEEDFCAD